jgi:hypothetical protein
MMTKSNFPYYEKDLQAVVECVLHDRWKEGLSIVLLCSVSVTVYFAWILVYI